MSLRIPPTLFVHDRGQMCNNILQYGHAYVWAREHGYHARSMRFAYKYIRRGDYARFLGGKYFYDDTTMIHHITQFQTMFPEKRIIAFICSNDTKWGITSASFMRDVLHRGEPWRTTTENKQQLIYDLLSSNLKKY